MMENDKKIIWEELSQEDKQRYLVFWFNYYGSLLYSLEEYNCFLKIIRSKADDIFAHICTSFICDNTIQSTVLLRAMREQKLDDLLKTNITEEKINNYDMSEKAKIKFGSYYREVREMIIGEIVKSFNNPEQNDYVISIHSRKNR